MFPLSEIHVISSAKVPMDTLSSGKGSTPDLSLSNRLSLSRFRTLATLDLSRSDLFRTDFIGERFLDELSRSDTLDICPPLTLPYGALDVRSDPIKTEKKYSDIYRRTLPLSLHLRRTLRDTSRYMRKKKKPLLISLVLLLSLSLPTLVYVRFMIESGYGSLLSIREDLSRENIVEKIHTARTDFERANVLFFMFRIIPGETFDLAKIALDGGLTLTRGVDTLMDSLPVSSGSLNLAVRVPD